MELHLFRCESATLRSHWVIDQFTCRIIGFGVHGGIVDGVTLCRMFQQAIRGVARGGGNQDCSLRAAVASLCSTDWHGSARVPRPHFILDPSGSGVKAIRFST
jgi:hypothetical protein